MVEPKWIMALALNICALIAAVTAEARNGVFREVCKYRKGKLMQPISENRRRLLALRNEMRIRVSLLGPEIDAYILTSYDEHLNIETAKRDRRLHFLTGFSGIKAFAAITLNEAALFVESRYVQQADAQLDCDWEIHLLNDTLTISNWLQSNLIPGQRVGIDPHLVPHHIWLQWEAELKLVILAKVNTNLIDVIWGAERPDRDSSNVQVQERLYAGDRWESKVYDLRSELKKNSCDAMIITSLTEISYLLNIRGRDIPYTPVVKSYLIISHDEIFFYVDSNKISLEIKLHLHTDCYNEKCVKIKEYHQVWNDLRTYAQIWKRVLVPAPCVQDLGASEAIFTSLPQNIVNYYMSPIIFMRAKKNAEERRGMHEAHIKDGAAICEAMSNLELRFSTEQWTEEKIKYEIERSRLSQSHSKGLSLPTVVAFGEHSSLPFYISSNVTDIEVTDQSLLVIESGSQYKEGTTDVTRTYIFGKPTTEMKRAYTTVLSGILSLSGMMFPVNITQSEVDVVVRNPLWQTLMDYPQAMGHGIGAYGAVEEPPISLAYGKGNFLFKEGYFFSCESGYYKNGDFGVRLKNVHEVLNTGRISLNGELFLAFEDITLVPYEADLIDGALLSLDQKIKLNKYNARIRHLVGEELKRQGNMQAFYWMMNKTRHIREYLPYGEYRAATGAGSKCVGISTKSILVLLLGLTIFDRAYRKTHLKAYPKEVIQN